jgi:hypothetical protein
MAPLLGSKNSEGKREVKMGIRAQKKAEKM